MSNRHTALNGRQQTFLDIFRVTAALFVLFGHSFSVYGLTFLKDQQVFPYSQNIGVVMLFLLSGFLLAYSLDGKSQSGDYTIAAFASHKTRRIFREYIPALILIALLDALSI